MTTPVPVCVEAVLESQIQEVRVEGDGQDIQEVYAPQLSMSENLAKLANKIDFYKDECEEKGKPTSEGEKESEEEKATTFQPSLWPWDSVRNKLKASLTEMSVLLDVLNIAKRKNYMVLDQVSQPAPDPKTALQLASKKQALTTSANILMSSAERLKKSQAEGTSKHNDFHIELLKLRQNWRLKKVGNTILGDLSYKTAGSRFWQGGTFEVLKTTTNTSTEPEGSATKGGLEVVIPNDLRGVAYIQVEVKSVPEKMDLTSAIMRLPSELGTVHTGTYWQQKLQAAQNVLFCKEIFSQLAREAVQTNSSVPHLVVGNQIITNVFPGIQLSIILCHSTGKDKNKRPPPAPPKLDHNHVLEHSLHQLLRELHYKNIHYPPPHPVTAMIGVSKKRRMAGPLAMSRQDLLEMADNESLLEQVIKQTKHHVLRQKTMGVLDRYAVTLSDPQLANHWNCVNSSLESSCRVLITSQGYDLRLWHSFMVHIYVDKIKLITREGRVLILSYEEKELEDFILWQISQHQISVSQNLSRLMGWHMLNTTGALGVSDLESSATASALVMASPNHNKALAIKSGPSTGTKVFIQSCPKENKSRIVTKDEKWSFVGCEFQEVDMNKFEGRNFPSKLETLMAVLTRTAT